MEPIGVPFVIRLSLVPREGGRSEVGTGVGDFVGVLLEFERASAEDESALSKEGSEFGGIVSIEGSRS